MRRRIISSKSERRGVALLYSLLAAFAAATMLSSIFALTLSSKVVTDVKVKGGQARYLAEGAIEVGKNAMQASIANWQAPTGATATINGTPVPYTVAATGFNTIATDKAGIQTIVMGYELTSTATVNGNTYTAHRLINSEATPVFQFAVFYTNDLEINPGPNMTLGGRVHSNKDMYLNCGGTLTCNTNYVHAAGSIYRNRKDDPTLSQGTVNIRNYVVNPFSGTEPVKYTTMNSASQMAALGVSTTSGYDARFTTGWDANKDNDFSDPGDWLPWSSGPLSYWGPPPGYTAGSGSTVMDNAHGVSNAAVPQSGSIAMFEPKTGGNYYFDTSSGTYQPCAPGTGTHAMGYYHGQAGLSIIVNAAGTSWNAYDGANNDVTLAVKSSGAISLGTMFDARQAGSGSSKIQITNIDIAKLKSSGKFPSNGLVYAAQYGAAGGSRCKGVQLVHGSDIGKALTVVSEDSIYIQGDYNTTNKKGCAVIADAVNLLSNAWNNSKTSTSGLPTASATTYNVAIISGNQDTNGSQYNGGLENLPRFHENWSGVNCRITGSFVNMWHSQFANGAWVYGGNKYTAPNRLWAYDLAFNTVANLPPFTPMSVTAVDAASW
jgi:hypothetical protein